MASKLVQDQLKAVKAARSEGMSDKLTESEFRLIAMGFGATLAEVDADCRERCSRLGQACWAAFKPRCKAETTVANGRMSMVQAGRCRRNAAPGCLRCPQHEKANAPLYVKGA